MRRILLCSLAAMTAASWGQARRPMPTTEPPAQHTAPQGKQSSDAKRAKDLLLQGMGRTPLQNVRAVIVQRSDYLSNVMQQIKVEMSRTGQLHQIVLAPLSVQGTELVDDGRSTRTYTPDDRCLVIQPSGKQSADDVRFRMNLVERNYNLRIDRRERIAGVNAVIVEAIPRNGELETRCYAIDEKSGFLLRLETCREDGAKTLHFEAKMVESNVEFSSATFRLDTPMGVTVRRFDDRSYPPSEAGKLRNSLRFDPVVPSKLPYGFAVQEVQAEISSSVPAVAVRVTDGLAKGTVYQWRSKGKSNSVAPRGTVVANTGQLTLLISGDLPHDVKQRIIRAFVESAQRERANIVDLGLSQAMELGCDQNVFPLDRDPEGIGPILLAFPTLVWI